MLMSSVVKIFTAHTLMNFLCFACDDVYGLIAVSVFAITALKSIYKQTKSIANNAVRFVYCSKSHAKLPSKAIVIN